YSIYRPTISLNPPSFLPLICHEPVHPGLTYNRCRSYSVYSSTSRGNGGRGPTIDILPIKTFQNCGNSSMLVLRINLPTFVIRGSSFILNIAPSTSFLSKRSFSRSSASIHIDRNLYILNIFSFFPILSCE